MNFFEKVYEMAIVLVDNRPFLPDSRWLTNAIGRFETLSYEKCEQLWNYGGKIISLARNVITAIATSSFVEGTQIPFRARVLTTQLKLFQIISVPFTVVSMMSTASKVAKSFFINDQEGFALNSVNLAVLVTDIFDTMAGLVNAALEVSGNNSIKILSNTSLPIGFFLTGTGIITRTMKAAKAITLHSSIDPTSGAFSSSKSKKTLRAKLERRFGVRKEEKLMRTLIASNQADSKAVPQLQEKRQVKLLRELSSEAMSELENLFALLDPKSEELLTKKERNAIFEGLGKIRNHLQDRLIGDAVSIGSNLVIFASLILFYLQVAGSLPFLLMAAACIIKLEYLIYQESENAAALAARKTV